MLDVKKLLTKILNALKVAYVVEKGTETNGWYYHKYSDGTYDAWQQPQVTVAVSTTMGNLYRSAEQTIKLPSFGKANTYFTITGLVNGQDFVVGNSLVITSPQSYGYYLVRGASRSSGARRVMFYAHGEWE